MQEGVFMSIIDDLTAALDEGDAPVKTVRVGVFYTAVVSKCCGLASTQVEGSHVHGEALVRDAGKLAGRSARDLIDLTRQGSPLEASIGVAALNSLLSVDETRCVELNAADFLEAQGAGRSVAIVGHFPFVARLRPVVRELSVIERRPHPGDLPEEAAATVLPQADVVAITGAALVNGTLEALIRLCRPGSLVMVVGPSTPLSTVLFDYGVSVISGTVVTDLDLALSYIGEGAAFRQVRGVRLLTMVRDAR
jgi:uncharacterized protein